MAEKDNSKFEARAKRYNIRYDKPGQEKEVRVEKKPKPKKDDE